MCGILGILRTDGARAEPADLEPMLARLAHRGPDGFGTYFDGPLGLGHRRLAIIDLEGGAQPMANEDGSVRVTFNGEIYNHHELRRAIEARHRFHTRSDTEVLVHLYEEHGPAFVERLAGFFALALWDAPRRRLVLARDGLGKKPLFLAREQGALVFASEVKALLARGGVPREVDAAALNDALALRYVAGARSGLCGIEQVLPGELIVIEQGQIERRRFWQPPWPGDLPELAADDETLVPAFRERFDAAVARRLEADVPLGLLLSGGIDSTAVLESMARQSPRAVRTFTVAFTRAAESEAGSAALAARHFGAEHRAIELSEDLLLEHLERILPELDQPFGDPSYLPTALICEAAREHVTVCLTGDGGDELFGGYTRYRETLAGSSAAPGAARVTLRRWLAPALPTHALKGWKLARALDERAASPEERYVARLVSTEARLRARLLGPRAKAELERAGVPIDEPERALLADLARPSALAGPGELGPRLLALDQRHYLPGLILTKADRASMAASLELRSPFLDTDLTEWAARVPLSAKIGRHEGKLLVRRALEGRVPRELLEKPKRGFGTPLGRWFRHELGPRVSDYLGQSRLVADGWLDGAGVDAALRAHRRKARNLGELLWTLLCMEVWYRTWVEPARAPAALGPMTSSSDVPPQNEHCSS